MMGVKRSQVSKAIKHRERVLKGDEACWLSTKRNVRCDAIKEEDKRVIYSVNVSKTVNALTDLVEEGSTVAIAAADDAIYDYYLFKVTSSGAIILGEDEVDDYSAAYQKGSFVFKGNFFLRDNIIDMTYKLDNKQAIVYANTVRTICGELKKLNRRRNVLFQLLPNQHEEIMSSF